MSQELKLREEVIHVYVWHKLHLFPVPYRVTLETHKLIIRLKERLRKEGLSTAEQEEHRFLRKAIMVKVDSTNLSPRHGHHHVEV